MLFCGVLLAQNTNGLEEVVVTDSRFELPRTLSGKAVIKLTAADFEKQLGASLATILSRLAGVEIHGSRSVQGQNLGYFIRGGNNRQVLILIDGIQVNDPSQPAADYDLRLLNLEQIASIEISKGASSVLYGSGAAAAVINIQTKKPALKPVAFDVSSRFGTNATPDRFSKNPDIITNDISASGQLGSFSYRAQFGHQYQSGMSAVKSGTEADPFSTTNTRLSLAKTFSENWKVNTHFSRDFFNAAFDNSFPLEDASFESNSVQNRWGIHNYFQKNNWILEAQYAHLQIERDIQSDYPAAYQANQDVLDLFVRFQPQKWLRWLAGINFSRYQTTFDKTVSVQNFDPYLNVVMHFKNRWTLNTGLRLNNHSTYGQHFTYSFNPSYIFEKDGVYAKLFGEFSHSFIAPSLSQLFGFYDPNPDLLPETDRTASLGVEFIRAHVWTWSLLYFNREERNKIIYASVDPTSYKFQYQNTTQNSQVQGIETQFSWQLSPKTEVTFNHTYTDLPSGTLRIPKHKYNISLSNELFSRFSTFVHYQWLSDRMDKDFVLDETLNLPAFGLIDLGFRYKTRTPEVLWYAEISNLQNTNFEEAIGYNTRGRNYRVGMRFSF